MNTNRLESLFRDLVGEDMEQKLADIDAYLSRELMLKRNIQMANRISNMLNDSEFDSARMFFAIGAGKKLLLLCSYIPSFSSCLVCAAKYFTRIRSLGRTRQIRVKRCFRVS